MLSEDSLKEISTIFCGDRENFFVYKTGPKLVSFFNTHFNFNDTYGSGFPSRWLYTYNKLVELINTNKFNNFLTLILSKKYIVLENNCTESESITIINNIYNKFKSILNKNMLDLIKKNENFFVTKIDSDLELLGSGGFANVYYQRSTGFVIKKLKEDFWNDNGICSRFKREFDITQSLADLNNVINVFEFSSENHSYKMEKAETTLESYVNENRLDDNAKINCIRQVLNVMKTVHDRNVIHRDISPNNIFIFHGYLKIADFGLGKDLRVFSSHQTNVTNSFGQFFYCAPEQFMLLKDADKRSDVFSLGRLINFIMTGDCKNYTHIFKSVVEKATSENIAFRYPDASVLLSYVEKSIEYHNNSLNKDKIDRYILQGVLNDDVIIYISELSGAEICNLLQSKKSIFIDILIKYMNHTPQHALDIIQAVEDNYRDYCKNFECYDVFGKFSHQVLTKARFGFVVNELAANILRYIAIDINRFSAQRLIQDVLNFGVEPLIEEVLQ